MRKGLRDSQSDCFRDSSTVSCTYTDTVSCLASEVDTDTQADLEDTQLSESSSSQKKRKRKMQEKSAPTINDRDHISTKPAKVDLIKIGQDDPIPQMVSNYLKDGTQLSELGLQKEKRKTKKLKKECEYNDKKCDLPELEDLDLIKTGDKMENSLISGNQNCSPRASVQLLELNHAHNRIVVNEKEDAPTAGAELDFITYNKKILASENQSDSSSARTGVVKRENVNDSQDDMLPIDAEDFKASPRQEKSTNHHRNSGKLSTLWEGTAESFMVADQAPLQHPNEADSFKLSENNVERVTDIEHAASLKVTENVFVDENSSICLNSNQTSMKNKKISETEKGSCIIEDNIPQVSLASPQRPCVSCSKKKLLILDVNGLLADIVSHVLDGFTADIIVSRKSVFKRPFCDDFLQFCFEKFDVGVWSSRTKRNVEKVIEFLMGDHRHQLLFCWDQSHCTDTGVATIENRDKPLLLKELKWLWKDLESGIPSIKGKYDVSNTILLDDSPCKAIRNPPHSAIFPYSYHYNNVEDSSLGPGGDLRVYLEQLVEAQNVQEFIAQNPFGQRPITESNPSWGFYKRFI